MLPSTYDESWNARALASNEQIRMVHFSRGTVQGVCLSHGGVQGVHLSRDEMQLVHLSRDETQGCF